MQRWLFVLRNDGGHPERRAYIQFIETPAESRHNVYSCMRTAISIYFPCNLTMQFVEGELCTRAVVIHERRPPPCWLTYFSQTINYSALGCTRRYKSWLVCALPIVQLQAAINRVIETSLFLQIEFLALDFYIYTFRDSLFFFCLFTRRRLDWLNYYYFLLYYLFVAGELDERECSDKSVRG